MNNDIIPLPKNTYALRVSHVKHYTDTLFHFTTDRDAGFRFRSGEFVMIALPSQSPVWRAYSIASANWQDLLEFYSIKVEGGPLTSQLQKIQENDYIWMRKKATGTLVLDALLPGKNLYLFSTGTGVAPFTSIIRDPETYEKFDRVILTHTTRYVDELSYSKNLMAEIEKDPLLKEIINNKLHYYATTTRDSSKKTGRISTLIKDRSLFEDLSLPVINKENDKVMICGSMNMLQELKLLFEEYGMVEGSNANPGDFVIERAFVG